ncbi:MAG: hypothetical protein ACP5TV_08125 [Anaerolineae bacterium]
MSFDVTGIVQSWVSGAMVNRGILLQGASGSGVKYTFCSSQFPAAEGWRRPKLTITYTTAIGSWQTITTQNFEGAFPGGWTVSDYSDTDGGEYYWAKRTCRLFAGSYSGWSIGGGANGSALACGSQYPNNIYSWLIFGPVSLADATAADLQFKLWLNSEAGYDDIFYTSGRRHARVPPAYPIPSHFYGHSAPSASSAPISARSAPVAQATPSRNPRARSACG